MDFKIVWTLRSREDLHDIAAFIAKDNPPAAIKLGGLIFNRVDSLEIFPELGRVVPERNQLNIRKGVSPGIRVNASLPAGCREAHKESFRRNSLVGFSGYFNRAALRRHFYKGRLGPWEYRRSVSFPGIGGDVFPDVWR
ncbi:MAG TPA: type II toxin-antitoxin system RelE/ParE family toxin [Sedimentisphaerales bacterium]